MTREEVIQQVCAITGLVYHSIREYSEPSDCFCSEHSVPHWNFSHAGKTLDYVREAVIEKLKRDGYLISQEASK